MEPLTLAILLFVTGAILLFAEMLLPTHGLLGFLGICAFGGGVVVCFTLGRWIGLSVFLGLIVISPFVAMWLVNLYPKTPVGRRMILQDETTVVRPPPVHIGQQGVTVTLLRPGGEVEFDGQRLEVVSEHGFIESGSPVKVVAIANNRAVVRAIVMDSDKV